MTADTLGPEDYRVVVCPSPSCELRFPGVPGVACPLCKSATIWAADRCRAPNATTRLPGKPLELLLDNVRSVFNVGSIFRSSDGAGVNRLYLCGITPTPAHKAMDKTALGAQQVVPWSQHNNALTLARELVAGGRTLWALEYCQGSRDLQELAPARPESLVLVLGNEVTGVDPELLALCAKAVHLPMRGSKNSLNVASAMAVAAYALC